MREGEEVDRKGRAGKKERKSASIDADVPRNPDEHVASLNLTLLLRRSRGRYREAGDHGIARRLLGCGKMM